MNYARKNIKRLVPYVPGEQPTAQQVVKLNTNENPYPPSSAVLDAVHRITADQLRRYPPPSGQRFRQVAATAHGVDPNMVIATNGGDELLRLAVTVFCEPGADRGCGGLAITSPTYSLYHTLGEIAAVPITEVQLSEDWSLPDDFAKAVTEASCRLAIVVSPHAPSGRQRPSAQLACVARALHGRAVLLIDEAYVDFADGDALGLLRGPDAEGLDNVLLLRTLSKGYSLAGLRFGYGLGCATLVAALDKARDSYNTDVVAQAAATVALEHREAAAASWQKVRQQRLHLAAGLAERGFEVVPSDTNFLLVTQPRSVTAATLYESLKRRGILVRYFDQQRLRALLRITVGTPEQNEVLLEAIDALVDNSGQAARSQERGGGVE